MLSSTALYAADTYWQNPGSGNWFDPANWTKGVPSAVKGAYVVNHGTAQVADGAAFAWNLWLTYASSTVAQAGGTMTIANTLYSDSDGACYRLQDGDLACDTLYLGYGGNGCFEQSGGTNTVGYLRNDYGRYTLSGADLHPKNWSSQNESPPGRLGSQDRRP